MFTRIKARKLPHVFVLSLPLLFLLVFFVFYLLMGSLVAMAFTENLDPGTFHDNKLQPLPELQPQTKEPTLVLPPVPKENTEDLASGPRVYVKKIVLTGNTVFSNEELSKITSKYTGTEITFEQLQQLRYELTLYYTNKGYINSGAVIPDQKVADGTIEIRVIEGKLTQIDVVGEKYIDAGYLRGRLSLYAGPPLNVYELQKGLQLLLQDPRFRQINAELLPGATPSESILNVKVEEAPPISAFIEGSNDYSPSIGPYGGRVEFIHNSVTGHGDIVDMSADVTDGLTDLYLSYSIPLAANGTTLKAYYRKDASLVIEYPFNNLDIRSKSDTFGLTISRPVYKTPQYDLTLGLTGEVRRSTTYLLGEPYSFSDGTQNGVGNVAALRFFQEWTDRSLNQVVAARSTFSTGLKALGATINDSHPDGTFFTWLGQFQWVKRLWQSSTQAIFRTDIQLSNVALLPIEKFAIGGMDSVMGYRKNVLVRDNGLFSSIELRIPVLNTKERDAVLQLAPFIDYGRSWNAGSATPQPEDISSAGLGLRWEITQKILLQTYYGLPFRHIYNLHRDPQDTGIYFKLTAQVL